MSFAATPSFAHPVRRALAGAGLLVATGTASALADPSTLLRAYNGVGGAAMDHQAKVAQTYDRSGSVTGDFFDPNAPAVSGSDRLVASVDFGAMGFGYSQTVTNSYGRVGTPLATATLGAQQFFTVSSSTVPLDTYIQFTLHATLRASFVATVDSVDGVPTADPVAPRAGVDFHGTALQARANGELLTVTAAQPFAELQYSFQVQAGGTGYLQGETGLQMGAEFRNQDARVTATYAIDALPANGKGLRMWITTDAPGTTLTFADGHSVVASVPEPATWASMLAGLAGLAAIGRWRQRKAN